MFLNKIKNIFLHPPIDFLVLVTGQKCTLRCKHCANFSPFVSSYKHLKFYNYEDICNDLSIITKKVNKIILLQVQGGEFFLHGQALEILQYLTGNTNILNVMIATNGTIIPSDEVLRTLSHNNKFHVRISNYPNVYNKISLLQQNLDYYGISNNVYNFESGSGKWVQLGGIDMSRLDESTVNNNFSVCNFRECLTLENGFISRCSRATIAHIAQQFNLNSRDGINIRKDFVPGDLIRFIKESYPVTACYYCYGTASKLKIQAAEQMTESATAEGA